MRLAWVGGALFSVFLTGCTPDSGMASVEPTFPISPASSPTSTWSPEQQAAVDAVRGYVAETDQIGLDPASFTTTQLRRRLGKWAAERLVEQNIRGYQGFVKNGWSFAGSGVEVSMEVSAVSGTADDGLSVTVSHCVDQTGLRLVGRDGATVPAEEMDLPERLRTEYSLVKSSGGTRG